VSSSAIGTADRLQLLDVLLNVSSAQIRDDETSMSSTMIAGVRSAAAAVSTLTESNVALVSLRTALELLSDERPFDVKFAQSLVPMLFDASLRAEPQLEWFLDRCSTLLLESPSNNESNYSQHSPPLAAVIDRLALVLFKLVHTLTMATSSEHTATLLQLECLLAQALTERALCSPLYSTVVGDCWSIVLNAAADETLSARHHRIMLELASTVKLRSAYFCDLFGLIERSFMSASAMQKVCAISEAASAAREY
jgi:hypothetical protein